MQFSKTREVLSVSKVTKPLLIISRLFGMNPKTHLHKIYTIFILVSEIFALNFIWQYHARHNPVNYYFSLFVHGLQNTCRMISLFVILGTGLFDRKRFMIPVKDFVSIDQSLKRLGGCLNDGSIYRLTILLCFCVGLMPFFVWLAYYGSHSSEPDSQAHIVFLMGWFRNLSIMVTCAIADCGFSSTLSIVSRRFRAINLIIQRFGTRASYLNVDFLVVSRAHTENDLSQELTTLRKQYYDLWRIASRVGRCLIEKRKTIQASESSSLVDIIFEANEAYGLHLLVSTTTSLAVITSKLWEIYANFTTSNRMTVYSAGGVSWIMFSIARMLLLAKACESTINEAKATYVALQELWMNGDFNPQTKAEIRDFFTQLQLETRNFTACGFFNIDCRLVCAILGATCTYLVILIQMGNSSTCAITHSVNESVYSNYEDRL